MILNLARRALLMGCVSVVSITAICQSRNPSSFATPDGEISIPVATGLLGQKDVSALAEVSAHVAVAGSSPWSGMQGTGKIVFGSPNSSPYDATLTSLHGDHFRLDAQTQKGLMSIRIDQLVGKIQDGAGIATMPIEAAISGLFPFQLPRLGHFPKANTSLIDHGMVELGGTQLHRITYERASIGRNPTTNLPATLATDLYFNPTSHLLIKTVVLLPVAGSRSTRFPIVTTYSDYRRVGEVLIPFRFSETMDGRQYWTLQLESVQINPTLDETYFDF